MSRVSSWKFSPGSLQRPLVIAHRGASSLAPENTIAAFLKAMEVGADAIEMDVRLSRDRQVVVMHDRDLRRTTGAQGPVGSYSLKELKSLEAGSWFGPQFAGEGVPTLEEVFETLPGHLPLYVELKARGPGAWPLVLKVVQVVRRHQRWGSTMLASFNPLAMVLVRALEPRITRGYIWSRGHPLPMRGRWLGPMVKPHWYAPNQGTFTPRLLSKAHARGVLVAAWDVDAGLDVERLPGLGLDGLVTDHPEVFSKKSGDSG